MPVIILENSDEKQNLHLSIGPFEASAIITQMENIHLPRPLTHDLFSDLLTKHKFKLTKLYIYKVVQDKYYSRIYYKRGFRSYSMEVRPSDGIALIIRHGGIIETNGEVLGSSRKNLSFSEIDLMSGDFLFLKNNNGNHTFM